MQFVVVKGLKYTQTRSLKQPFRCLDCGSIKGIELNFSEFGPVQTFLQLCPTERQGLASYRVHLSPVLKGCECNLN